MSHLGHGFIDCSVYLLCRDTCGLCMRHSLITKSIKIRMRSSTLGKGRFNPRG